MKILIRWLISPRDFSLVCMFELSAQSMEDNLDIWKHEMKFPSTFLPFGILNIFSFKHRHWILCVGLHYSSLYLRSHPKVPNFHLYILLPVSLQKIMELIKKNTQDITPLFYRWLCMLLLLALSDLEDRGRTPWQLCFFLFFFFFLALKRKNNMLLMGLY